MRTTPHPTAPRERPGSARATRSAKGGRRPPTIFRARAASRLLALLLAAPLLALTPPPALADIYVVAQAGNPQHALTQKEALDLFMGRSRAFANGEFAQMYDLPSDSPVRLNFYQALTGLSQAQINSYWSRLMFTGQTMPPRALASEQAMVEVLKRTPGAIGYLGAEPADKSLRTLLVIKDTR